MAGTRTKIALQLALILSVLEAQCCVLAAEQCAVDPTRVDAMFQTLYAQVDDLRLIVTKQRATCRGAEHPEAGPVCQAEGPMGMEDGRIQDSSITASSTYQGSDLTAPYKGRLNSEGWWKAGLRDTHPWVQVDFKTQVNITGVITQGPRKFPYWVEEYEIALSQGGSEWTRLTDDGGVVIRFTGNSLNKAGDTEVTNRLPSPVKARFLRIYPVVWYKRAAMRFEVLGCYPASDQP